MYAQRYCNIRRAMDKEILLKNAEQVDKSKNEIISKDKEEEKILKIRSI